jgi:hypothetical protein
MKREDSDKLPPSLARALDALAVEDARVEPPARIDIAALAAFRDVHGDRPKTEQTNVVPFRVPSRPVWIAAVAAAVLVAVFGVGLLMRGGAPHEPAAPVIAVTPGSDHGSASISTGTDAPAGGSRVETPTPGNSTWRSGRTSGIQSVRNTVRPQPKPAVQQPYEVTTDYYPLVAGADLASMDGGQVVRMRVPRASLSTLGFQMDSDRPDDDVTADVVLGNDGIARAIRFVQTFDTAER